MYKMYKTQYFWLFKQERRATRRNQMLCFALFFQNFVLLMCKAFSCSSVHEVSSCIPVPNLCVFFGAPAVLGFSYSRSGMLLGAVELSRDDKDYQLAGLHFLVSCIQTACCKLDRKVTSVTKCTRICMQITFSFQVMFGRSLLLYEAFQNDFCK